jgi:hypothetical protein
LPTRSQKTGRSHTRRSPRMESQPTQDGRSGSYSQHSALGADFNILAPAGP